MNVQQAQCFGSAPNLLQTGRPSTPCMLCTPVHSPLPAHMRGQLKKVSTHVENRGHYSAHPFSQTLLRSGSRETGSQTIPLVSVCSLLLSFQGHPPNAGRADCTGPLTKRVVCSPAELLHLFCSLQRWVGPS